MMRSLHFFASSQRGVALITVLMVVALSTSVVTYLIWVVNQRIALHEMHYKRLQSRLVAKTGIEWAGQILLVDLQKNAKIDTLNEVWAQQLPSIPVRIRPEDPSSALLIGGRIHDAQAKFNVNNLVYANAKYRESTINAFRKLVSSLSLPSEVVDNIIDWLDDNDEPISLRSVESDYYLSLDKAYRAANQPIAELANLSKVRGLDANALDTLRPHLSFLPRFTTVNINTASADILSAIIPGLSYSDGLNIVKKRKTTPFESVKAFIESYPEDFRDSIPHDLLSVHSDFFYVNSHTSQQNNFIRSVGLIERGQTGWPVVWWQKIE